MELPPEAEPIQLRFKPKWFLNGFPKAGLHLVEQLVGAIADPMEFGQIEDRPWAGTFGDNSWTTQWVHMPEMMFWASTLQPGTYYKGHCGWAHNLEAFLWALGVTHVFIYRDFRDVAVSQLHHIMDDNESRNHPNKEAYRALGHDDALAAVITGLGRFPGVMDRWAAYAGWTRADWVFQFKYEDFLADPEAVTHSLIMHGFQRLEEITNLKFHEPQVGHLVERMVGAAVGRREKSPTFRAGRVGDWRQEFNEEHKRLFKETDKNGWLIRLGYEQDDQW